MNGKSIFGMVDVDSPSQMAQDQAYMQKLLKKDAELNKLWNEVNDGFSSNAKDKKKETK